jgi:hypothetical protein
MVATLSAYDSLADFMASLDPVKVVAFHAPEKIQLRVEFLLNKQQNVVLNSEERKELDHYLILEHIVRLAKSKAMLQLKEKKR